MTETGVGVTLFTRSGVNHGYCAPIITHLAVTGNQDEVDTLLYLATRYIDT